ncbi:hypothetical protein EVAR_64225_1 [Eumeta japonica]|uniref:Uncharacterized protein n=1 Tax=Eumeta variegata TaxID=151549 RepID=A0A4C1ZR52_EUMVA|nr:hypothetical protein EVAR_64225_1 [Eumeta japonica]
MAYRFIIDSGHGPTFVSELGIDLNGSDCDVAFEPGPTLNTAPPLKFDSGNDRDSNFGPTVYYDVGPVLDFEFSRFRFSILLLVSFTISIPSSVIVPIWTKPGSVIFIGLEKGTDGEKTEKNWEGERRDQGKKKEKERERKR